MAIKDCLLSQKYSKDKMVKLEGWSNMATLGYIVSRLHLKYKILETERWSNRRLDE